jgi:SpoVK/Ycf46/Vps4 family AAA+-type ATPase
VASNPLIESMRAAVAAAPDDVALRLHLASLLLDAGHKDEAIRNAAAALERDPGSAEAQALLSAAFGGPQEAAPAAKQPGFDWDSAEEQVSDMVEPMFVEAPADQPSFEIESVALTLADVGGMEQVKQRLEAAFLAPMRNPELRKLYGKSLRGGLLLYGPPGCGKTFIARAVAGEMGAQFVGVSIHDVLDMWVGSSERNLHDLFDLARRNAPCVLFIDEVDAIGQRRSKMQGAMRTTVNQLLAELDGVDDKNEASSSWGRPTIPGTWTARCAAPAGSIAPCWCCRPTRLPARRSSATTSRSGRSPASTPPGWPLAPTTSREPTSPTSARARPSGRCSTRWPPARCA